MAGRPGQIYQVLASFFKLIHCFYGDSDRMFSCFIQYPAYPLRFPADDGMMRMVQVLKR